MEKNTEKKNENIVSYEKETIQKVLDLLGMIPVSEYNPTMAKAEIFKALMQGVITEKN